MIARVSALQGEIVVTIIQHKNYSEDLIGLKLCFVGALSSHVLMMALKDKVSLLQWMREEVERNEGVMWSIVGDSMTSWQESGSISFSPLCRVTPSFVTKW